MFCDIGGRWEILILPQISLPKLLLIILLEGFVTISLEIVTIRQLIPFTGNSVIVTSLIIGIFLLFLAIGYRRGGLHRENYLTVLYRNFTIAAIYLGIGLSFVFTSLFFYGIGELFSRHILFILTAYLFLVMAPIVYILGQTIPITTNLFRQTQSIGEISGTALYVSTLGSFLGAVLTSMLLLNFLGVAWSIVINYSLLFVLILLLIDDWYPQWQRLLVLTVGLGFVYIINVSFENSTFLQTNNYANYRVYTSPETKNREAIKVFDVNNSNSSFLTADKKGASYIERIKKILFQDLKLSHKNILVIGAGGFSLSAENTYGNQFTYVDIDPAIYNIANQHFIDKIKGKFVAQDARLFFKSTTEKYDVILLDAYSNGSAVPFHLLTREYFQSVREALKPDGAIVMNVIANPLFKRNYMKRLDNTINTVFLNCMKMPEEYADKLVNILYVCKSTPNEYDNMMYTDNLNRAPLDFFSS